MLENGNAGSRRSAISFGKNGKQLERSGKAPRPPLPAIRARCAARASMDGTKAFEGLAHTIILCVRKLYSTGGTKCQSDQYDMPFLGTSLTAWSATVPARRTIGMDEIAFAFGECVLFPRRRQLLAESKPIKLGSRAFDTLVVLVEAEGKLVTKNELLKRVWHDTTVEEKNIAAQIAAVRRALRNGDELVKTDAGRGYRFTGTVRRIVGEPVTAPVSVPSRSE